MESIHASEMPAPKYQSFRGTVTDISLAQANGCSLYFRVENSQETVAQFLILPSTFFLNRMPVRIGDQITVFYDTTQPTVLIYPPRYTAVAVFPGSMRQNVKLDYFDQDLVSSDNTLKLVPSIRTQVLLENGQPFLGDYSQRDLMVLYTNATRSIPAQTTPEKIIVICRD